ncbi:MAG: YitT family protein [Acidobacteria bacterium]|nr:YitT family protein [Acidobacteriota bacterium]
MEKTLQAEARNIILILVGIFLAGMGIKGFLLSSHFIDGGVTGISMLVSGVFGFPLPILLVLLNLPFVVVGYYQLGLRFGIKSGLGILGLSLCLAFIDFPDVTSDKLLTAIFGGLFIGAGIGLAIRGGAVLDGTEIAALLVSRRVYILNVGDVILLLNVIIFGAAALSLGIEPALYSILTYAAATKALDFLLHGFEEYTAITIVSPHYKEIREVITQRLLRGVTVFKGGGGLGGHGVSEEDREILYCVVTRLEIGVVKAAIKEVDRAAFITTHSLNDVDGGLLKRTLLH